MRYDRASRVRRPRGFMEFNSFFWAGALLIVVWSAIILLREVPVTLVAIIPYALAVILFVAPIATNLELNREGIRIAINTNESLVALDERLARLESVLGAASRAGAPATESVAANQATAVRELPLSANVFYRPSRAEEAGEIRAALAQQGFNAIAVVSDLTDEAEADRGATIVRFTANAEPRLDEVRSAIESVLGAAATIRSQEVQSLRSGAAQVLLF